MQGALAGLLGCIFGVLGVFTFGFVFVPLASVCALVGLIRGLAGKSAAGVGMSLLAGALAFFGFLTSPSLWLLTAGAIATGAVLTAPAAVAPPSAPQGFATASPPIALPAAQFAPKAQPAPPVATTTAAAVHVPVVGCPSEGQSGPIWAPPAADAAPSVPTGLSGRLAYYGNLGLGALGPRGWHCFELYGSGGAALYVTPEFHGGRELLQAGKLAGPAILLTRSSGGTSGRFEVARIAAPLFPSARPFVERVLAEGIAPASEFRFQPYPWDSMTRISPTEVEYMTPGGHAGLGTENRLTANGDPISGVVILLPEDDMDLVKLDVRLPEEMRNLTPTIVSAVERGDGFIAHPHPAARPTEGLLPSPVTAPSGTPAAFAQARAEFARATQECRNLRLAGELKSYVASVQCSNPRILAAYQRAGYRYMDLIVALTTRRLAVAERTDQGRITEAEGQAELAQFVSELNDRERERNRP